MPCKKTFDPKSILVRANGIVIEGFVEDEFINAERNESTWTMFSGADGCITRIKNNNKSGTITLTLQKTSDSNAVLDAFRKADESANAGSFNILIVELPLGDTVLGIASFIEKPPPVTFAGKDEVPSREWVILVPELVMNLAGSADLGG